MHPLVSGTTIVGKMVFFQARSEGEELSGFVNWIFDTFAMNHAFIFWARQATLNQKLRVLGAIFPS